MKYIKKILFLIVLILILINICTYSFAATTALTSGSMKNTMNGTSQGLSTASSGSTGMKVLNTILRVFQVAGVGYIVIKFTYVGIKYFTASAADTKAEIKSGELVRTLITAVIITGAVGFFEILYNAFF